MLEIAGLFLVFCHTKHCTRTYPGVCQDKRAVNIWRFGTGARFVAQLPAIRAGQREFFVCGNVCVVFAKPVFTEWNNVGMVCSGRLGATVTVPCV